MNTILAALVIAIVVSILFAALRTASHAVTGTLDQLPRKDNGRDEPVRGIFLNGGARPDETAFLEVRNSKCPLHGASYCGMTVFAVMRAPHTFDLGPQTISVEGHCYLISCSDCIAEAQRYRWFTWHRGSQGQHPVWASTQLYPLLTKTMYIQIAEVAAPLPFGPSNELAVPQTSPPSISDRARGQLIDLATVCEKVYLAQDAQTDKQQFRENVLRLLSFVNTANPKGPPVLAESLVAFCAPGLSSYFVLTTDSLYYSFTHRTKVFADGTVRKSSK